MGYFHKEPFLKTQSCFLMSVDLITKSVLEKYFWQYLGGTRDISVRLFLSSLAPWDKKSVYTKGLVFMVCVVIICSVSRKFALSICVQYPHPYQSRITEPISVLGFPHLGFSSDMDHQGTSFGAKPII